MIFCHKIYIDEDPILTIAMCEDILAFHIAEGEREEFFRCLTCHIDIIHHPSICNPSLKAKIEHIIARWDFYVPAEYRVAFCSNLNFSARDLREALLQEVVTMVGRVERHVGGYIFPCMFITKGMLFVQWRQDQRNDLLSDLKFLFQLLAEQCYQQAVERGLDGLVNNGELAVLLLWKDVAEKSPVLWWLRNDAGQKRLRGGVLSEEDVES